MASQKPQKFSPDATWRELRETSFLRPLEKETENRGENSDVFSGFRRELKPSNMAPNLFANGHLQGGSEMKDIRNKYRRQFKQYPDLVSVSMFREMLGGIGDSFARRLIREQKVKAIFIKPHYWIPKESVIDYVLSEDYASRKLRVRV